MRYEVIKYFTDLEDNDYAYNVGDTFPRLGKQVTEERVAMLLNGNNKRHERLLKAVAEDGVIGEEQTNHDSVQPLETEEPKTKRKKRTQK